MFKKLLTVILATLIVVTSFIFSSLVFAEEGLTISPPLSELTLNPGTKTTQIIKVTNTGTEVIEVYPVVLDFRAKGETGEPEFYTATEADKYALSKWIKFTQTKLTLTPKELVEFKYQIEVPKDAEPGGHYGAIFLATQPSLSKEAISQISIASMLGSLVLVKVPGIITENGILQEFTTAKKFYLKPPIDFTIRIANTGTIHFKPQGNITIKSLGGKTVDVLPVNQTGGTVLPNSTRKFEESYNPTKILVGRYTANLQVVYGEAGKTLTGELIFWVLPWWSIAIAVIIVCLIIYCIVRLIRKK